MDKATKRRMKQYERRAKQSGEPQAWFILLFAALDEGKTEQEAGEIADKLVKDPKVVKNILEAQP